MEEYWKSVDDAPEYLVSDLGRVARIVVAKGGTGCIGSVRILKPSRTNRGYWKVCLGRKRQEYVHRLVASAFLGACPLDDDGEPFNVDHLDFDTSNNSVVNLRWLAFDENRARQRRYGAVAA